MSTYPSPLNPFEALWQLHREALMKQFHPIPLGPDTERLYQELAERGQHDRERIARLVGREHERIMRWLVHESGADRILPTFLPYLAPYLRPEAHPNPQRLVGNLLLRSAKRYTAKLLEVIEEIARDARATALPRLSALMVMHNLKQLESLQEYLTFRTTYQPTETIGHMARMGELHAVALEDLRTHLRMPDPAADVLLLRLAYLVDHSVLQQNHPILDNP